MVSPYLGRMRNKRSREEYRRIGRLGGLKGGQSRSDAKVKAARENLKIASPPLFREARKEVEGMPLECECGEVLPSKEELEEHQKYCSHQDPL